MSLSERLILFWEEHPRIELMIFAFALHGILAPFTGLDHDIGVWLQVSDDLIAGRNPYVEGLTIPEYYAYPPNCEQLWRKCIYSALHAQIANDPGTDWDSLAGSPGGFQRTFREASK
ncbi:MAG: hypothetical protein ACXACI_02805 [Candidatus Hodarchaeales archaeon]|jgi:hypothetical protein